MNTCGNGDVDAFDMDADGDLDVFLTEYLGCGGVSPAQCWIRANLGNGTFGPPYAYELILRPEKLDHGDLDFDGHEDLVLSDAGGVTIGFGRGNGTFEPPVQLSLGSGGARDVVVADVDLDGFPDVVASSHFGGPGARVSILLGNGDRSFQPPRSYHGSYSSDLANARDLIVADVDADGLPDLMTLNGGSNDFSYFRNLGKGTFRPQLRYGLGPGAAAFAFADVSGDGVRDMAALVGIPPFNLSREIVVVRGLREKAPPGLDSFPGLSRDSLGGMDSAATAVQAGTL